MKLAFLESSQHSGVSNFYRTKTNARVIGTQFESGRHWDVLVIGGGITGLSAALTLSQLGVSVGVFEARHFGWGASGRAWGQVTASTKLPFAQIEKDLSSDRAQKIISAASKAPDLVSDLIRTHAIECQWTRSGNIMAAQGKSHEQSMRNTAGNLMERGYPVELLTSEDCRRMIGSSRYSMAIFDPRGGSLNPFAYTVGLAAAAESRGAALHENVVVKRISKLGSRWSVCTDFGSVTADQVVLATNAFTSDEVFPGLARQVYPIRGYQCVSEPLDECVLAEILPGRQTLQDTRKLFSGIRIWPDGRLHIGVDGPPFGLGNYAFLESASRRIADTFPSLPEVKWEEVWGGWVDMSVNQHPLLLNPAPAVWCGFGLSGRGIGIGTILGQDLAYSVAGKTDLVVHPVANGRTSPIYPVYRPLSLALLNWYRVVDRWNDLTNIPD